MPANNDISFFKFKLQHTVVRYSKTKRIRIIYFKIRVKIKARKFLVLKPFDKFIKIINFIKNRLLRPKDNEKYNEFTIDLYTHKTIDQETFDDIRNNYSKDKRKDDFER